MHRPLRLLLSLALLTGGGAHAGIPIHGKVMTEDGDPLPGVAARLLPVRTEHQRRVDELAGRTDPEPVVTALTGDDGIFELEAPAAGFWAVNVAADGFMPMDHFLWPLVEEETLPPLVTTAVRVVIVSVAGPDGAPVPGAVISATGRSPRIWRPRGRMREQPWRLAPRRAVTGADGRARLPRAGSETIALRAFATGSVEAETVESAADAAALTLRAGETASIKVTDPAGRPAAGAVVLLDEGSWALGVTGEDGLLSAVLPAGAHLAAISPDGARGATRGDAAAAGIEIELQAPEIVTGRIVEADSRRPLPRALVWSGWAADSLAESDRGGGFTMQLSRLDDRRYIQAAAPGHFTEWQQVSGEEQGEVVLALRPAAAARGRVIDERGDPVAGAELEAQPLPDSSGSFQAASLQRGLRARAGADGGFLLRGLVPQLGTRIVAEAEGYAPAELELGPLAPRETRSDLELVLRRGTRLSGFVTGGGEPLAGAELSLLRERQGTSAPVLMAQEMYGRPVETASDGEGAFDFTHLAAGDYRLTVRAPGFAPLTVPGIAVAAGGTDLGILTLEPGVEVTGVVVDGDGRPLADAAVQATASQPRFGTGAVWQGDRDEPAAKTGPDGSFRIVDRLRGERLDLHVSLDGYSPGTAPGVVAPNEQPLRIVLERASRISGVVVDPRGNPIAQARVWVVVEEGGTRGSAVFSSSRVSGQGRTGVDGRFVIDRVSTGRIRVMAIAQGWRQAELDSLEVPPGADLEGLRLVLEPGATITGQVLAADGAPVPGCFVSVEEHRQNRLTAPAFARSDGEGRYVLEGVEPGVRMIIARDEHGNRAAREIEVTPGVNRLDLSFRGGFEVSGRVLDDAGAPIPGATVALLTTAQSWGPSEARTGDDGLFRLQGVEEGEYLLRVAGPGYATSTLEELIRVAGASVSGIEVRLARGGAISGRILGLEPRELADVHLMAVSPPGKWAQGKVRHDATYRVEGLVPGDWHVQAIHAGGRRASGRVTLEAGATEAGLDLDFSGGLTLSGQVVSGGEPLAGMNVMVSGVDVAAWASGTTDHEGRFRVAGLKAGRHHLQVSDFRSGLRHSEEVELEGNLDIVVELATGSVSGLVLDGDDLSPLANASVALEPLEGVQGRVFIPSAMGNTTDHQGRFRLANVAAGTYRLQVVRDGYAPAEAEVTVAPDAEVGGLELRLEPSGGLRLVVLRSSGLPPAEVRYALLDGSGRALTSGSRPVDDVGRVRLPSIPAGTFDLLIAGTGTAVRRLAVTFPGPEVRVDLEPACRLELSVSALAAEETVALARLTTEDGQLFQTVAWGGMPQQEWPVVLGKTTIEGLPPGTYGVEVTSPDGRAWQGRVTVTPGGLNRVGL